MKKSVAPSAHLTNDDLLQGIIENLRPWKKGLFKQCVEADVRREIGVLCKAAPLWKKMNDRRAIREHAKKLDKALDAVEKLVKLAPGTLELLLFLKGARDPSKTIEDEERAYKARIDSFFGELRGMRKVCKHAINNEIGDHPNHDTCKRICATFACGLMEVLSDEPVRSSSPKDNFRVVAGLLYQIVMRCEDAPDLERACDAELRPDRGIGNVHFRGFVSDSRT
jgi:hypothetical protein